MNSKHQRFQSIEIHRRCRYEVIGDDGLGGQYLITKHKRNNKTFQKKIQRIVSVSCFCSSVCLSSFSPIPFVFVSHFVFFLFIFPFSFSLSFFFLPSLFSRLVQNSVILCAHFKIASPRCQNSQLFLVFSPFFLFFFFFPSFFLSLFRFIEVVAIACLVVLVVHVENG